MANPKTQMIICRTCIRDNPSPHLFENFEKAVKEYKKRLRTGLLKKAATLRFQNCFAQCEYFYCVQVQQGQQGYLFKKIASLEKLEQLIDWVKKLSRGEKFQPPEELKSNILKPVHVTEKYPKA